LASAATEPAFLAARRERAVRLSETLELPQFKDKAGWEFTDISALDLGAYGPAPRNGAAAKATPEPLFAPAATAELRQIDAGEATLTGSLQTTYSSPATMPASTAGRSSTCRRTRRSPSRSC